jgi:glycosyltransferase involved in cell wall biosynthesis
VRRLLYLSADPGVPVLGHKGASVHLRELVAAFDAAGVSVVVASPRIRPEGDTLGPGVELVEIDPVLPGRHRTVESLRRAMAAQALQVEAIARERAVEAIYERSSLFSASGVRASEVLRLPHALEMNAPLSEEARQFRSLPHAREATRVEARVREETDHIFAVSAPLADRLADDGVARAKVIVAPNGVDPLKFRPDRRSVSGSLTVGFLGSLKPWHGVGVLLEAFARALARRRDLRLEIVGTGPEAPAIERVRLPPEQFAYHGPLPHAVGIAVMSSWDVGVAPFLPLRGFYFSPLKVVEYMAAGVCTIGSDLGQIRSLLGGGERGVLVEAGEPEALADAILRLASNRERAAELGARARAYVHRTLSWSANAKQALDALGTPPAVLAS